MKSITQLVLEVWSFLSKKRKKSLILVSFLIVLASIGEAFSIGAVLPFLAILTSPEKIFENQLAQPFINFFQLQNPSDLLLPATVIFSSAAIISGIIRLLLLWSQNRTSWLIGGDLTVQAYERTLHQPYSTHISRNSSEILAGTIKARELIGHIVNPVLTMVGAIVITIVVLSVLIFINATITFLAFLGISMIYVGILKFTRIRINKNSQIIANQDIKLTKTIQEGLGGIRDVLLDRSQKLYTKIYYDAFEPYKRSSASNAFISKSPRFAIETLGIVLIALLAYFLTEKNTLDTKTNVVVGAIPILGTLALGAQRLLPLLQQLFASYNTIRSHRASISDALELLNQPIPNNYYQDKIDLIKFKKYINFKDISFRYSKNSPWIFQNINIDIPKGSKVGFIGKTGSGKSTFLDLTMGLLNPNGGYLKIDDIKIDQDNNYSWQKHISHVPQDIYLADTTIAENIALGIPSELISLDKVYVAAKEAKISELIESLPDGYQTLIGERGVKLSGGQKQRIGIARAFYKRSSVIILDEATSALDNETESSVIKSIEDLGKDLTVLIVTHRLSTLKFCDFIIKFENGKIIYIDQIENL